MRVPPVTVVLACGAADRRSRFRIASHKRLDMARSTNPNTSVRPHRKFGRGASYEWMTTRRRLSGTLGRIATMASRTIGPGMLLEPQPAHRNETPWDFEPSGYPRGRTVAQAIANIRTRVGQMVSPSGSRGKFRRYRPARSGANPTAYPAQSAGRTENFRFSSLLVNHVGCNA